MSFLSLKALASLMVVVSVIAFLVADVTPAKAGAGADAALYALGTGEGGVKTAAARTRTAAGLQGFPTGPIKFRDYRQTIHPIEGTQNKLLPGWIFSFHNVIVTPDGEVITRITEGKNAAFKWELEKRKKRKRGRYVVEATLPPTRPGVVAAPLWLFSEGDKNGGYEFDFELMNGRIEYNLHNSTGGFNMRKVYKDLGGHRVRFEIIRKPNKVTMRLESLTDGFTDELVITPKKVRQWAKYPNAPEKLHFPPNRTAMFPVMEFWVSNAPGWVGEWEPLERGESLEMVMHGYSFTEK